MVAKTISARVSLNSNLVRLHYSDSAMVAGVSVDFKFQSGATAFYPLPTPCSN